MGQEVKFGQRKRRRNFSIIRELTQSHKRVDEIVNNLCKKMRRFPHHKQVEWQPAEYKHSNDSEHHLNHLQ